MENSGASKGVEIPGAAVMGPALTFGITHRPYLTFSQGSRGVSAKRNLILAKMIEGIKRFVPDFQSGGFNTDSMQPPTVSLEES